MNDTIIDNINSVVQPDDTLWHLGDFAFGDKSQIPYLRSRIKCRNINLLFGNHDHALKKFYRDEFQWTGQYKEITRNKTLICMMHYPLGSWNQIGRGAINLYGHCHSNYSRNIGRQMDVGVDNNNFMPLSLDEILERMRNVPIKTVDHHDSSTSYH